VRETISNDLYYAVLAQVRIRADLARASRLVEDIAKRLEAHDKAMDAMREETQ
jgi:hypothetical protein